jgi:hypothetical protein
MQCNVDKRLIEILNTAGIAITWEEFRLAYGVRKLEREKSPDAIKRRALAAKRAAREMELSSYFLASNSEDAEGM